MENQEVETTKKNVLLAFEAMNHRNEIAEILTGTNYLFTYVESHELLIELISLNQFDILFTSFSADKMKNINHLKMVASCDRTLKTVFVSEHLLESVKEGLAVYHPEFMQRPLNRTDLISCIEAVKDRA